jgi:hypothetical protein
MIIKEAVMRAAWLVLLLNMLWVATAWAFLTDTNVHTAPTQPPALATAGAIATDPTFGTKILRVTDGDDSTGDCGTMYSNKPATNSNNTKIMARCLVGYSRAKVWDFNAATLTHSNGRIQANPPSGFQEYDIQWSHLSPDKYYGCGNKVLYEITIPAGTSTTFKNTIVRNFAADFTGTNCTQISMSEDDDVFAFRTNGGAFIAYKRSTDTILLNVQGSPGSGTVLDEVEIDKSGRYLVVCCKPSHVYDLQATPITNTTITNKDFVHRAMGNGIVVSGGGSGNLVKRNLATPNIVTTILGSGWSYSTRQDHFSLNGSDQWFMGCRYRTNAEPVAIAFDNECVEVSTTGNQAVRRHLHHRSTILNNDYNAQPKGSVSYDGRFLAFTSNWENANGRMDMYIAQVLQVSGSGDVTSPSAPTNLRVQ